MRTLGNSFRTTIESSSSAEIVLIFVTITHPTLEAPIFLNNDIKDYILNGNTYLGAAISISLLSDEIGMPKAKVSIPNVDRAIGEAVLGLTTSPQIEMDVYARSDFDNSDPRVAIGTPTVEYRAQLLFLRNVTCDPLGFTADLLSYDLSSEPWPAIRSTKNRLPGLYR